MLSLIRNCCTASAVVVAVFSSTASAQTFTDTFDTYPAGPLEGMVHTSGATWHGWAGADTFLSQVSPTFAETAPHSAELVLGCDTVIDFDDMTGGNPYLAGRWLMSVDLYIPAAFTGKTYFLVMNQYDDAGTLLEWSVQVGFDGLTGQMVCDCGGAANFSAPIVLDQWFTCTWDIDIDNDWVDYSYDTTGVNLSTGYTWSGGTFGGSAYANLSVNALDLYPDPGVVPEGASIYIDNFNIAPVGAVGTPYCFGNTASGNPCPCSNDNDQSDPDGAGCANGTYAAGAKLDASGMASVSADTLVLSGTRGQPNNSSLFFQAENNLDGNGCFLGDGIRCAGGHLKRLKVKMNDATGAADTTGTVISVRSAALGYTIMAGDILRYQWWYRDTNNPPCGLGVNDSNTSNGYEIVWLP